jgi:hypothetical protein
MTMNYQAFITADSAICGAGPVVGGDPRDCAHGVGEFGRRHERSGDYPGLQGPR